MAAITYPISVRSLADMFPGLSQISALDSHKINESKAVAYDAEATVKELEPLIRLIHELSHEHIEAAKNHAHVLRAILGGDILARLDEIQNIQNETRAIVDDNRVMLQETRAMMMNIRLAAQNAKVPQERDHYKPLQKTLGRKQLFTSPRLPLSRPLYWALFPPSFDRNTDTYTLGTINSLVIFYNDDFDIEREDNLGIRKIKFRRWLYS
ncbi:hypothetical protein PILCRDRAFT_92734 [Piloderma croceum F 1598]|uniref:Uncharacterized protein n=1 Tax=Piloderma croceum (strain F 1598) TaxID=765440 RepID=A0A0C3ENH3_PILCF|nr:hypothetical protein PILCRDRAFT_92734 [Piloderma croceum F 1598]